jgi:hypothetical protein
MGGKLFPTFPSSTSKKGKRQKSKRNSNWHSAGKVSHIVEQNHKAPVAGKVGVTVEITEVIDGKFLL